MANKKAKLITPYGGKLVNLVVEGKEREELLARASKLSSIKITMRNLCDLELIATGGFSPLTTFMGKADYERVLKEMRLADGTLFPLPITLTADPKELPTVGDDIVLRNANNDVIAIMTLDEVYHWDANTEAGDRRDPRLHRRLQHRADRRADRPADVEGGRRPRARHLRLSVLAAAWRLGLPATVHVAIGTDIVHVHPACDPAARGRATHLDFRLLAAEVARLGGGRVYLNVGSAVVLPEVFLKALTLARNLGHRVAGFSTANLDFIQSYRPGVNVGERLVAGHGRGFRLTGHHEILVPLVAAALVEKAGRRGGAR